MLLNPTSHRQTLLRSLGVLCLATIFAVCFGAQPMNAQDPHAHGSTDENGRDGHAHGEHKGHDHAEPQDHDAHKVHDAHKDHDGHKVHKDHEAHKDHDGHDHDDPITQEHHRHGHNLHHDFSDVERWSAVFDSPERTEWQRPDEVIEHMQIAPGHTVADIGAGTGYFLPHLAYAASEGRVLALDPEASLVEHLGQRIEEAGMGNAEARRIPFDDPQLDDSSVDRLLIVNTWHHIEQREAYSKKLHQALRDGGRVFVVDFTRDSPSGPPIEHRLAPEKVMADLEAGGFRVELLEETLPRQYIVVGHR